MTHKKFRQIRIASLICNTLIQIVLIVFIVLNLINGKGEKLIPLIITLIVVALFLFIFLGRVFCGFLCPVGFFQDVIWKITEKLHLPKLSRDSKFMKVIKIFNLTFLCFFICGITSLIVIIAFFPKILNGIYIPIFIPIIVLVVMIILNSLARRFFCNVCPVGSFIGLFKKLNIVKLKKDCSSCSLCGACYEACPMKIKKVFLETEKSNVSNSQCLYCGECIKKCSNDNALSITICDKQIYKSSREDFMNNQLTEVSVNKKDEKQNGRK